jgi:hypothetical protein
MKLVAEKMRVIQERDGNNNVLVSYTRGREGVGQ